MNSRNSSHGARSSGRFLAWSIFHGTIDIVEHLGELTLLYVNCGYAEPIIAKLEGNVAVKRNAEVQLSAPIDKLHVFDEKGQAFPRAG